MGFTVDLGALEEFRKLLLRAHQQANKITHKMVSANDIEGPNAGELMGEVNAFHEYACTRAEERAGIVATAYTYSESGVDDAIRLYRETDDRNEARLDATYRRIPAQPTQDGERPEPPPTLNGTPGEIFNDREHVDVNVGAVSKKEIDDLEPKLHEVEDWVNWLASWGSAEQWIRWILEKIITIDPVKELIEIFSGDWREYAKIAGVWLNCADAYEALATNTGSYKYLEYYWTGNAADAAWVYFEELRLGVESEARFHKDFLYPLYKEAMQQVYDAYNTINTILGMILDTIITMGASAAAKIPSIAPKIKKLWEGISSTAGAAKASLHGIRLKLSDMSSVEPPCPLEEMTYPQCKDHDPVGYRHPGN